MTLKDEYKSVIANFSNLNIPESKITATITAENTGELMDLAINENCEIIKPFTVSSQQNYYYFEKEIKKKVKVIVKSVPKRLSGN